MFYHLTRRPMEETLLMLLGKSAQAGWKVVVRGSDLDRMAWLDLKLWQGPEDLFLPHGLAGGAHDAAQPVLLTTRSGAAPNRPECLMTVDGAALEPDEVAGFERVCVLFDGNDADALQTARAQWKALKEGNVPAQYWSEESGRWEKKAET